MPLWDSGKRFRPSPVRDLIRVPLEFSQATKHCQPELAVGRCGIRPGIRERLKRSAGFRNSVQRFGMRRERSRTALRSCQRLLQLAAMIPVI